MCSFMKNRRVAALVMCLALCLVFAACGRGQGNEAYNNGAGNAAYAAGESEEIVTAISVSRVVEETSPESPAEDSFIVTGDTPFRQNEPTGNAPEPATPAYGNLNELGALVFSEPRETVLEFEAGTPVNLAVNVLRGDIRISVGGDKLTVRYNEWAENHYSHLFENGTLSLEMSLPEYTVRVGGMTTNDWLHHVLKDRGMTDRSINDSLTIEITVPEHGLDNVNIDTVLGAITLTGVAVQDLNINTATGAVRLENTDVGMVQINAVTGAIGIVNGNIGTGDINAATGAIRIENSNIGTGDINAATGVITLANSHMDTGDINAATGSIRVADSYMGASSINTSIGRITVAGICMNAGSISTSMGAVTVSDSYMGADSVISSFSGNISLSGLVFSSLSISNGTGNTGIYLSDGASNYDFEISLSDNRGRVTYNGQNVERMLPNPNAVSRITYSGGRGTFSIRDR